MAKLLHEAPPESVLFSDARIAGPLAHGGVDHHQTAGPIDDDRLTTDASEREHPPLSCQYPDLVTVAPDTGLRLAWAHARSVLHPSSWNNLSSAPVPIVGEQQPQARVVAQNRIEAAVRCLLTGAVDEPGRVSFGPDRLPDFLLQVISNRSTDRLPEHETEHLGLNRSVVKPGAAWRAAYVVWGYRIDAARTDLPKRVCHQPHGIVLS